MRGKSWTTEEEGKLRKLVEDKLSLEAIAGSLGMSVEAVHVKVRRLGLVVVDHKKKNSLFNNNC